jgi:hypothetical protein
MRFTVIVNYNTRIRVKFFLIFFAPQPVNQNPRMGPFPAPNSRDSGVSRRAPIRKSNVIPSVARNLLFKTHVCIE